MSKINFFPKSEFDVNEEYIKNPLFHEGAYCLNTNIYFNDWEFDIEKAKQFIQALKKTYDDSINFNEQRQNKISEGASYTSWENFFEDNLSRIVNLNHSQIEGYIISNRLNQLKNTGYKTFLEEILTYAIDDILPN
ncbi:MAG: hypothetical protein ACP5N3_02770 [Candidatus Nanoarchaeia archaeon]